MSDVAAAAEPVEFSTLTPRKVVEELDKYIVGQDDAKKAVAIALRNRWRRQNVEPGLRDEIIGIEQIVPSLGADDLRGQSRFETRAGVHLGQFTLQAVDAAQIDHRNHAVVLEVDMVAMLARADRREGDQPRPGPAHVDVHVRP